METLGEFVARLSNSVGCYNHLCGSGIFSLKKVNTDIKGRMGVFAYVSEQGRKGLFRVDMSKAIAERAAVSKLSNGYIPDLMWGSPGVFFSIKKGSINEDYQKAVKALRMVLRLKRPGFM